MAQSHSSYRWTVFVRLAISGICLVTNKQNPVPNLTRAQIQDLVAARIATWAGVPGSPRTDPVQPAGRAFGSGVLRNCSRATIQSGAHPAASGIYFVTRGSPRGRVANFIGWAVRNRVAGRIIARRYIPVPR